MFPSKMQARLHMLATNGCILQGMRTLLLLGLCVTNLCGAQTTPTSLAALRDRFRPLLLFAASPDDPALLAQMHMLKDSAAGLAERDVVVIAIPYRTPSPTEVSLGEAEGEAARRRFKIAPGDFAAVLLGKDGEEKLRSAKPIAFRKLRETIDAMPMRQDEMRERGTHPSR